jgi:hypothetical protein
MILLMLIINPKNTNRYGVTGFVEFVMEKKRRHKYIQIDYLG